jgi:TonB family protein
MKRAFISAGVLFLFASFSITGAENTFAQTRPGEETLVTGAVLTKLSPPIYPPLALQARISGAVRVEVSIRMDGSIESARLVDGHAILKDSALDSARKSLFECRNCVEPLTPYLLTYTFEMKDNGDCCNAMNRAVDVSHSQGHIVIVAPAQCICDPAVASRRFRSAKCLYLWKCGRIWFQ